MRIEQYSEKSIVLRGENDDTRMYADELKMMGGKWNPKLEGGGGWIFSKKKEKMIQKFLDGINKNPGREIDEADIDDGIVHEIEENDEEPEDDENNENDESEEEEEENGENDDNDDNDENDENDENEEDDENKEEENEDEENENKENEKDDENEEEIDYGEEEKQQEFEEIVPGDITSQCFPYVEHIDDHRTIIENIKKFCEALRTRKLEKAAKIYIELPMYIHCVFLEKSNQILKSQRMGEYSLDTRNMAKLIFNLYHTQTLQKNVFLDMYKKHARQHAHTNLGVAVEKRMVRKPTEKSIARKRVTYAPLKKIEYKKQKKKGVKTTKGTKTTEKKGRAAGGKKYDKEYQRYAEPSSSTDPLYIFYTSLYQEVPESKLAITWLTEHGVYEGDERSELLSKYKSLAAKDQLVK